MCIHSVTCWQILEPASAFMFFEQQLEELVDDHELGEDIPYYDTNQVGGTIARMPPVTLHRPWCSCLGT